MEEINRYKKINYLPSSFLNELLFLEDTILELKFDDSKEVFIIGDLHQDDYTFFKILTHTKFFEKDNVVLIFLGDYVDRGEDLWLINKLLVLKYEYKNRVFLLRGNHEIHKSSSLIPPATNEDDFFNLLESFAKEGKIEKEVINIYAQIFETLPIAISLEYKDFRFFLTHAGIPRIDFKRGYFSKLDKFLEEKNVIGISYINDFLWNDVGNDNYTSKIRYEFSEDELFYFLKKYNFDYLIRAHQYFKDGFNIAYKGRVITIFSNGNSYKSGYFNDRSVYNLSPTIFNLTKGEILYVDTNSLINAKNIFYSKNNERYSFKELKKKGRFYKGSINKLKVTDCLGKSKVFVKKTNLKYKDLVSLYGISIDFNVNLEDGIYPKYIDNIIIDSIQRKFLPKKYIFNCKGIKYVLSRNNFSNPSWRKSKIKKRRVFNKKDNKCRAC